MGPKKIVPRTSQRGVAPGAVPTSAPSFIGFDTSIYPGDQKMRTWKTASPYSFTGYYLRSPCHFNASWSGTRERLEAMGWGIAVLYVGRQAQGPCSTTAPNAGLGTQDGADAAMRTSSEGFPPGSVIFLDVEPMDRVGQPVKDYVRAWFAEVLRAGFVPSVYCHVKNAVVLRSAALDGYPAGAHPPIFWVAGGPAHFDPASSAPTSSGVPFAGLWQGRLDTTETHGGVELRIDVDIASSNNPSAVYVGAASATPSAALSLSPPELSPLARVSHVIQKNLHLFDKPEVIQVRAGYRVAAGQPTGQLAIVAKVLDKDPNLPVTEQLPRSVEGIHVDVRQATPVEQLKLRNPQAASTLARTGEFESPQWEFEYGDLAQVEELRAAAVPTIPYKPPNVPLDVVEDVLTINCHASPDCGWPTLKPFLEATRRRLTIGMYDIGAQHVIDTLEASVEGHQLTMVLDSNPAGPDEHPLQKALKKDLGTKLKFAWAAEATSRDVTGAIFPNAYHIKVVVRDGKSMWLSSGNWMDSNQPDIDPINKPADRTIAAKRNREWHVIVDHAGLSSLYEKYLRNDLAQATPLQKVAAAFIAAAEIELFVEDAVEDLAAVAALPRQFFKPLVLQQKKIRVQPLLTPDNYASHILPLIQSAKKKFYMQTQYMHAQQTSPAVLVSLVNAVQDRIKNGVDVRIIVHEREANDDWVEKLHTMGFDTSVIRIQPGIHNKGMVVDSKVAVVGSQNWSGDGVSRNRDASLILFDAAIAKYFEKIFLHDWTRLARTFVPKPVRVLVATPGAEPPPGFHRTTLAEFMSR